MIVEASPEIEQLVFEIRNRPKQRAIQVLASNGADQPFHQGMGQWNIGDGCNLGGMPKRRSKTTSLRDCTTIIMSRIFMPAGWISETQKSNEIS